VKTIKADLIRKRKRRMQKRLQDAPSIDDGKPVISGGNVRYELASKAGGTAYGGMAAIVAFARKIRLPDRIDSALHVFKKHQPFHESDHVLNFAYNALCGGTCLQDMELRRNDEFFLDAIGAERIPDPTTAGDFCRRFSAYHIQQLQEAFDEVRLDVWKEQDEDFFAQATIDMDGSIVETTGQSKVGMDISYKGVWGYHPLVLTLAETGEVLRLVNRSGNQTSQDGAFEQADQAIAVCRRGGFRKILLRGDTAFTQTVHLDRWDSSNVKFVFGMKAYPGLVKIAENVASKAWKELPRRPRYNPETSNRARPENIKEQIVAERGFKNKRLTREWITEVTYRPTDCRKSYRLVIVRKELEVTEQRRLFEDYEYFFYLSNNTQEELTTNDVVYNSNKRCNQENVLAQLIQCRALHAPVDNLESNWAFMVMTALSWTLKAWIALSTPVTRRWESKHKQERQVVLRMEFKRFVEQFVRLPAQVIRSGRQITIRLLSWTESLEIFNRWLGYALE
jgi:Transposase DDE domain group 1